MYRDGFKDSCLKRSEVSRLDLYIYSGGGGGSEVRPRKDNGGEPEKDWGTAEKNGELNLFIEIL